jgi:hypothetical protein
MKLWSSLPALEYRATFIAAEAYLYGKMRKAKKLSGVTVGECERLLYGEVWRELFLKTNYKYTFDGSPICGTKSVSEINLESLKHFVLLAAITSLNSRADPPSGQIEQIINDFASLQTDWNLRLNKKKSEILTQDEGEEIAGIRCVKAVKYLGVRVTHDKKEQIKVAKEQVQRNINALRWRLKRADPDVLQQLTCCLARSLLIYIGTPMSAVGIWRR